MYNLGQMANSPTLRYVAQRVYLPIKSFTNTWVFQFIVAHDLELIKQVYCEGELYVALYFVSI